MKYFFVFNSIILFFFLCCLPLHLVCAFYDPLSVPNNKYGIHVADTTDISDTALLINSTNGDWGYVTIVMEEKDRDQGKWQQIFNTMRRLHLIPIIRLATHIEKDAWVQPQKLDADKWADFLNSLRWPIENRYVILFNEPNHKKEWGNVIDPEGYANLAYAYAQALKKKSEDFFILPAGLDTAASTDGNAMDAIEFLQRMYGERKELFTIINGWTSHSYPNPAFSGSPVGFGKGTIQSFIWELEFLSSLGLTKKLPVFITETGWVHNQGKLFDPKNLSPQQVGQHFITAASSIWNHPSIVAITPFVFSYLDIPFDHFSWKKINTSDFYSQYQSYQKIPKIKGEPKQHESYTPVPSFFPETLVTNSTYTLSTILVNTGQSIVHPDDGYELIVEGQIKGFSFISEPVPVIEPEKKGTITMHVKTPTEEGEYELDISLRHGTTQTRIEKKKISIIPPPNMTLKMTFGWTKITKAEHVKILVYDQSDTLLHKFSNLTIENNTVTVTGLYNMVPGRTYRVVLIVPYFLPRQTLVTLDAKTTHVSIKRLLPFDINNDGALSFEDIKALFFTKPHDVIGRFF